MRAGQPCATAAQIQFAESHAQAVSGLGPSGKLIVVAERDEPLEVNAVVLIMGNRTINGRASGTGMDSEDTLNFSALAGAKPLIET